MDYEKAKRELDSYLTLLDECAKTSAFSPERRAALRRLNLLATRVNSVLSNLTPDHSRISGKSMNSHKAARQMIQRAVGQIANSIDAMEESGLPINALAGMVWFTAKDHWEAGRYRNAVSDVSARVNSYAQQRIGRYDVSDKDLMAQAFSEKPPEPGLRRLWCPGDKVSLTVRSQQEGAKLFAMGCYAAIRNPAHHLNGEWLPTIAFEYLAAFSILERWVRSWDVVCHPDDVAEFLRQQSRIVTRQGEEPRTVMVASADQPGIVSATSTVPKSKAR